jgi:hypothetical protein
MKSERPQVKICIVIHFLPTKWPTFSISSWIFDFGYTPIFSGHIKFSKVLHNTKQPESSCNVQICQDFRGLISSCIYYHLHYQVISSYIKLYIPRFFPICFAHHFPSARVQRHRRPWWDASRSPVARRSNVGRCRCSFRGPRKPRRERRNHNGTKILKRTEADHSLTTINGDLMVI